MVNNLFTKFQIRMKSEKIFKKFSLQIKQNIKEFLDLLINLTDSLENQLNFRI